MNMGTNDKTVLTGKTINQIISETWSQVIPDDFPVWEGTSRGTIVSSILRHYWMREIGMETVGYWKYAIGTRLMERMSWYVDLHGKIAQMADIYINQIDNYTDNMKHGHTIQKSGTDTRNTNSKQDNSGTRDTTGKTTGTVEDNGTNDTHTERLMSETPQNGLDAVRQGKYLTRAELDSNTSSTDNVQTQNLANELKEALESAMASTTTDEVQYGMKDTHGGDDLRTFARTGFSGDKVDVIQKYITLHLNLIEMIVKDVADCFMGILG